MKERGNSVHKKQYCSGNNQEKKSDVTQALMGSKISVPFYRSDKDEILRFLAHSDPPYSLSSIISGVMNVFIDSTQEFIYDGKHTVIISPLNKHNRGEEFVDACTYSLSPIQDRFYLVSQNSNFPKFPIGQGEHTERFEEASYLSKVIASGFLEGAADHTLKNPGEFDYKKLIRFNSPLVTSTVIKSTWVKAVVRQYRGLERKGGYPPIRYRELLNQWDRIMSKHITDSFIVRGPNIKGDKRDSTVERIKDFEF